MLLFSLINITLKLIFHQAKHRLIQKNVREIFEIGEEVEVKVLEINLENENKRGNMVVSAVNLENFEGKEAEDILKDLEK